MIKSPVPELVMVNVIGGLAVPLGWFPKAKVVGATEIVGAVPFPDNVTFAFALPVMASVAARVPWDSGLNASGMVTALPGVTVIGLACVGGMKPAAKTKSALLVPVIVIPLMMRGAVPELVSVRVCVAL